LSRALLSMKLKTSDSGAAGTVGAKNKTKKGAKLHDPFSFTEAEEAAKAARSLRVFGLSSAYYAGCCKVCCYVQHVRLYLIDPRICVMF
jgi:hypothetical protein